MGLAERRAVKDFQDKSFPALKSRIDKAAGFSVPLEVKWESLAVADHSHLYTEGWSKVYFEPVIAAFDSICRDQMGKDALKASLKGIEFCSLEHRYGASGITFVDGLLRIDHEPCTNIDDVRERTEAIVKLLEAAL